MSSPATRKEIPDPARVVRNRRSRAARLRPRQLLAGRRNSPDLFARQGFAHVGRRRQRVHRLRRRCRRADPRPLAPGRGQRRARRSSSAARTCSVRSTMSRSHSPNASSATSPAPKRSPTRPQARKPPPTRCDWRALLPGAARSSSSRAPITATTTTRSSRPSPNKPAPTRRARPTPSGQPEATVSTMLVSPYNDLDTLRKIVAEHHADIAAIIRRTGAAHHPGRARIPARHPRALRRVRHPVYPRRSGDRISSRATAARSSGTTSNPTFRPTARWSAAAGPCPVSPAVPTSFRLSDPKLKGQPGYTYFNGTLHGNPVAAAATHGDARRARQTRRATSA